MHIHQRKVGRNVKYIPMGSQQQNHVSLSNELLKLTCSDPETQFRYCVRSTREYGWSTPARHHRPDERRLAVVVVGHREIFHRVECG